MHRDQVVAALLVAGVVVVVGYASGLGLRTSTTNAGNPGSAVAAPAQQQPAVPDNGGLPEAVGPPTMSMPGDDQLTVPVSEPLPQAPVTDVPMPGAAPQAPGTPTTPPNPTNPAPTNPGAPSEPAPATCLPGALQAVPDTVNTVVGGLPVVGPLTGTLGLTQSPDGTSPGAVNTLLYSVTGYCAPAAGAPATDPLTGLTGALSAAVPSPALPKAGG